MDLNSNSVYFINSKTGEKTNMNKHLAYQKDCVVLHYKGLKIVFKNSYNNTIYIDDSVYYITLTIGFNDVRDSSVTIKENCWIEKVHIGFSHGKNQQLIINKNLTFVSGSINLSENAKCIIDEDCMFSHDVNIWASDFHTILDKNGNILNGLNKDDNLTYIGKHVWLCFGSTIFKLCTIPDNCVVAGKSVCLGNIDFISNSLIGGYPAKTLKKDISWNRRNNFQIQNLKNDTNKYKKCVEDILNQYWVTEQ